MSDEISFKVTSFPVTEILSKQTVLKIALFPESVYKFKADALNHHELKAFTAVYPFESMIFVFDGVASKIWLINNSYVAKLTGVDVSEISHPKDICAGRIKVKSGYFLILVM